MFEINTDNELSNFDIIKIIEDMKLSHVFGGVYSKDQLPILERNKFYIINLQDSDAGSACGYYCIAFIKFLHNKTNKEEAFKTFLKLFNLQTFKNDKILYDLLYS